MPGGPELILIFLLVLILFGAKKLPELARGLGQAANEFRKAKDEFNRELEAADPNRVNPQAAPQAQPYGAAQQPVAPAAPAPAVPAAPATNHPPH
ncbi:MAG: twin-arginine translocase TatA/TatE family subunit [Verrucomicrobia bacterium]|nr:twin-arginine translocase TatA/TatE family subunit [Verrucomicrobiota bacterium]